jgi:DNA polymerase-3 subunit alpha
MICDAVGKTEAEKPLKEYKIVVDAGNKEIYKGISSIKYMNETIAEELFEISKNNYENFVDLLVDIAEKTTVNSRQMKILIKLNFFDMFGKNKYLFDVYEYFMKKYKKTLKDTTKLKRIDMIKEEVKSYKNEDLSVKEILETQSEFLGYLTYKNEKIKDDVFYIVEIEGNYQNKMMILHRLKDGVGYKYKLNKRIIEEIGVQKGQIVKILSLEKRPKNELINGKWTQNFDHMETYITSLKIIKN